MSQISDPEETLSVFDAVLIVVGIVVGMGIFKTPAIVAAVSESGAMFLLFWITGGLLALVGALCFAELASAFPHAGGDYHFLRMSCGPLAAYLFAWSRMMVLQPGSIAMVSFVFGDYASTLVNFGPHSQALYAAGAVIVLTLINVLGLRQSRRAQRLLTGLVMLGILVASGAGFWLVSPSGPVTVGSIVPSRSALGTAMIFVLLTYGGWNEAAFLSAEVRSKSRNMFKVLTISIGLVGILYLLVNAALLRGLGLSGLAESRTVVTDLLQPALGPIGVKLVTALILVAALSTVNATMITGARSNYALGRDYRLFRRLGEWNNSKNTPVPALLFQSAITLLLILLGCAAWDGFVLMIEYTAPVFWLFMLQVALALFILRRKHPEIARPFRVPGYPLVPALFCITSLYMLYASLVYTGFGAWVGMAVCLAGIPLLWFSQSGGSH